ncbi:MAG TPA: protocatechuate 3,4-dioxygenase [Comamonadaceae bacterium]|nr:protocatechuate 3,4-dioxygenase [Comamonadaceae bacterium]
MKERFIFGKPLATLRPDPDPFIPHRRASVSKTIPGTTPFDGDAAQKGYALNKMCFSFNQKENREAFVADPEAYMKRYGLNEQQAEAIRSKQVLAMIAAGGNAYYLAKFAGIFGLDMQDIGAQQTGMTKGEFKAKLVAANEQC